MRETAGRKRGAWFWVGVTLLSISALWWLILISVGGDVGDTVLTGLGTTVVPIGIGIYCVRRSRKATAADMQRSSEPAVKPSAFKEVKRFKMRKVIIQETSTSSALVIKLPVWFRVIAWFMLVLPPVGILMLGATTKVTFNQPPGYITIVRGHVPLFLWFLRTKCISREEARSAFVRTVQRNTWNTTGSTTATAYEVRVTTKSGKEVKLYDGAWWVDVADYLAKRILDFAQEADNEAYRQKLDEIRQARSGAKFSMRVEEAFRATFTTGVLGMVVAGTVEQGTIRNGDEVEIRGYQGTKRAKVFEVDTLRGSGAEGERVQVLVEDVTEDDVKWGDIVERV